MDEYLLNLYNEWRHNPAMLFGNLTLDQLGLNGYSTLCPPVPWLGSIEDASCAIISFEPALRGNSFFQQIQQSFTYEGWGQMYFANYFNAFNQIVDNPFGGYWSYLAEIARGLTNEPDLHKVQALSSNLVELPFCQYHSVTHPQQPFTHEVNTDFLIRLGFYGNDVPFPKVLVLGNQISNFFRNNFPGEVLNEDVGDNVFNYPIEARNVIINDRNFVFFLRNAPMTNGHQDTFLNCFLIGNIIANYQAVF